MIRLWRAAALAALGGLVNASPAAVDERYDYCVYQPPAPAQTYGFAHCASKQFGVKSIPMIFVVPDAHARAVVGSNGFTEDTMQKARDGDGPSSYLMGRLYAQAQDQEAALFWYHRGADAGDAQSMTTLGQYAQGAHKPGEADKWFRAAADKSNTLAMIQLGLMYGRGEYGATKDPEEAVRWYKRGAALGNIPCIRELANAYAKGEGVERNAAEALRLYLIAASKGDPLAEFALANLYETGDGITKNEAEAARWYRTVATDWTWKPAMIKLSAMYHDGRGVPKDEQQAEYWRAKSQEEPVFVIQTAPPK